MANDDRQSPQPPVPHERVDLSEGQETRGAQVIQTTGLPDDFEPPTMSISAYDAGDDGVADR